MTARPQSPAGAESSSPVVNSVLHATRILDFYAAERREYLSLSEISRATGLHKTTTYRILKTLQSVGWIEQSAESGKYKLGSGILMVASAFAVHNTSHTLIVDAMRRLLEKHNETVVLGVLRNDTGICVELLKSHHSLTVNPEDGYIIPLHIGATGKTLLAAQPPQVMEELLGKYPDAEAERLRRTVSEIRCRGYCFSEGEVDAGVAAVSVPLVLPNHIYVLSFSGPIDRLRAIGYDVLGQSLLEAVRELQNRSTALH